MKARGTATAPLLFWLAVICGLSGITMLRLDRPDHYVPLWFGAVVGISIGQLLAVLRLRVWVIAVFSFALSWFIVPAGIFVMDVLFGGDGKIAEVLMALLPAAVCGYASLSERGGLVAFWFPAMLWMVVILDGAVPGSFSPSQSVPLVVGLAALFIAFLRARETRRASLWQAHATVRLAPAQRATVLRASPLRGLAPFAWTLAIGGGTLLLAATIAPKLWQKEHAIQKQAALAAAPPTYDNATGIPCCPTHTDEAEKVKEYLPVEHAEPKWSRYDEMMMCSSACQVASAPVEKIEPYAAGPGAGIRAMSETWHPTPELYGYGYGYGYGDPLSPGYSGTPYVVPSHADYGTYAAPTTTYTAPTYVPPPPPVTHPVTHPVVTPPKKHVAPPPPPAKKALPPKPPASEPVVAPAAPVDTGTPWGWILPTLFVILAYPLASRYLRRRVALRHLARPFWRESLDQRISNHWQRILVGLRDAGIYLRPNETPQAFAKRVGIEGMEEAATILERVRHGVRVELADLRAMNAAATAVFRTARARAGVAGRTAAAFRWPLV